MRFGNHQAGQPDFMESSHDTIADRAARIHTEAHMIEGAGFREAAPDRFAEHLLFGGKTEIHQATSFRPSAEASASRGSGGMSRPRSAMMFF